MSTLALIMNSLPETWLKVPVPNEARAGNAGDRHDVVDEIEIEIVVETRVDCVRRDGQEERITVRRRTHDLFGGNIASGARPVLDDEWLAKPVREPLTHQADKDVSCSAARKPDDQAHRPRRIGLRLRDPRHRWQRGSARGQMQKIAAGKFHFLNGYPRPRITD